MTCHGGYSDIGHGGSRDENECFGEGDGDNIDDDDCEDGGHDDGTESNF